MIKSTFKLISSVIGLFISVHYTLIVLSNGNYSGTIELAAAVTGFICVVFVVGLWATRREPPNNKDTSWNFRGRSE